MKRLLISKLALVACVLLLSPAVFAQRTGGKMVLLQTGESSQKGTTQVTKIIVSDAAREGMTATKLVSGDGENFTIEFSSPLPNKSQKLMFASALPVDDIGTCGVPKGTYNISYARSKNGTVTLPVGLLVAGEWKPHKRRPTKKECGL